MDELKLTLSLEGAENVTSLHVHVEYAKDLRAHVEAIMADVADVVAKVGEVNTAVQGVMDTAVETLKDVQRLIANQDTQAAVDALDSVITNLNAAKDKVAEADAAIEAASPEPSPTPEPEPTPTPTPEPGTVEPGETPEPPNTGTNAPTQPSPLDGL